MFAFVTTYISLSRRYLKHHLSSGQRSVQLWVNHVRDYGFQRGQIVWAHMVGASASKIANVFGVSRGTVSKIMTTYRMTGKTVHLTNTGDRNMCCSSVSIPDWNRQALHRDLIQNKNSAAAKVTAELSTQLTNPISPKTGRRKVRKHDVYGQIWRCFRVFVRPLSRVIAQQ